MRNMLRPYSETDDEEARTLAALLEQDQAPMPATVELPEVQITAEHHPQLREEDFDVSEPDRDTDDSRHGASPIAVGNAAATSGGDGHGGGMDWQMIGALLLDAGLNRGRGAGQLVGAYANNQEANAREKRQLAAKHKDDAFTQWVQTQRLEGDEEDRKLRGRALDLQAGALGLRKDTRADKLSPDTDYSQTQVELAKRKGDASVRGREGAKHDLNEQIAEDAANVAEARATATTNATTEALAGKPRALTADQTADNARADEELQLKRDEAAYRHDQLERQRKADNTSKYNRELGDAMTVLEKARQLQSIFKAHPNDLPGVGAWDASSYKPDLMKSPDDIAVQQIFAEFANPQFKDVAGRAVTGKEQERVLNQVGNLKSTNEDVVRQAVDEIAKTMAGRIRSDSVGREDLAREILAQRHLDDLIPSPTPAPASATPQARPASVDPLAGARELPVTGDRKTKLPGFDTSEQAKPYNLRSPTGQTGVRSFTPSALQQWLNDHPGWEVF